MKEKQAGIDLQSRPSAAELAFPAHPAMPPFGDIWC